LSLQAGDLVNVLSKGEIMRTLNDLQQNRGLFFDVEMVPYCGRRDLEGLRRVERIINEKDGRMMEMRNPCPVLDGSRVAGS
jgi:hypothetical protein